MVPAKLAVVVQGPVVPRTREISTRDCLLSARAHFRDAQLILSTWEGADTTGLDYDILVANRDPGAQRRPDGLSFNLNRQIVSTLNGLRKVSRPYVIKIRTDSKFISGAILQSMEHARCSGAMRLFSEPVVSCTLFARNPAKMDCPLLFHPSDCLFYGRIGDLLDLWDIPLYPDSLVTDAWKTWRYTPEQWLWTCFLRKHGYQVELHRYRQFSLSGIFLSERSIAGNLVILSPLQLGVDFSPPNTGLFHPGSVYSHED